MAEISPIVLMADVQFPFGVLLVFVRGTRWAFLQDQMRGCSAKFGFDSFQKISDGFFFYAKMCRDKS
jgi:hypothetical protein